MLKDILISMIIWVVVGCGNGSGVKRLDTRAVEKDTVLKWSQLVGESRLVRLEMKEEALLNDYFRVWAGEKYIITYGNEEMYQFAADGTYIRKLASYGRAPGEYQNIIALTVDEPGERLYFSDYGRQNSIQVINLKNGEYENSLPGIYGFPKKMILAGDSILYCIPLLLKDAAYEIYALTSSGQFLGGIKKETCREERQKNHSYLGIAGGFVHYMSGITDTLYRITADTRKPEYYFHAGYYLKEFKPDEKGEEIEMIVETSRFILFDRLFIRMADSRFGKNIITYDENRDPETYVFDKLNDGLFKVKSIYFDDLDFELEDYLFEVSEHYLCQSFSAMKFRERIKSANSPYHDWYNAIADDDNPVLVLGKVRN